MSRIMILVAFFLSGGCALIHEVTWVRMLYPVFGMNLYAVTVVLATFMGGLGVGSAVIGRWSDRFVQPLRAFALVEMGIGIYALGIPSLVRIFPPLVAAITPLGTLPVAVNAVRLLGAASLILLPCILMGGSFPAFSKGYVREEARLGGDLGLLYAVNTCGAVAGCLLTGLLLLPNLGMPQIVYAAGAGNLVVGSAVWFLSRGWGGGEGRVVRPSHSVELGDSRPGERRTVLAILFLTGFLSLSYEILWTRALTQIIRGTYVSFALILAALLIGITVGSGVFRGVIARRNLPRALRALSLLLFVSVAGSFLALFRLSGLMSLLAGIMPGGGAGSRLAAQFVLCLVAFLPSAILFGMIFPLCLRLYSHLAGRFGEEVGRAYAVNTGGAVIGVLLTGLVSIGSLGSGRTLVGLLLLNLAVVALAVRVAGREGGTLWRGRVPAVALFAAVFGVVFIFPRDLFFANQLAELSGRISGAKTVLFRGEDSTSMVTVVQEEDHGFRYVKDGQMVIARQREAYHSNWRGVGGTRLYLWNLTSAYLATLLHPAPESILVIGYGSGRQTATLTSLPDPKRIEVVEINRLNFPASSYFFFDADRVLRDPRVSVVVDDGRNYLLRSRERYDVIIVDVGGLDADGSEFFYTQDFLRLCRDHLRDGGMLFTWLDIGHLLQDLGWMYQNTFRSVFPESSVWFGTKEPTSYGWLWVVGVNGKLEVDYGLLKRRWNALSSHQRKELHLAGIDSADDLLALHACDLDRVPRRIEEARILTDAHPYYDKSWVRRGDVRTLLVKEFFSDRSYYDASFAHLYYGDGIDGVTNLSRDEENRLAQHRERFYAVLRRATTRLVQAWLSDNVKEGEIESDDLAAYVDHADGVSSPGGDVKGGNLVVRAAMAVVGAGD